MRFLVAAMFVVLALAGCTDSEDSPDTTGFDREPTYENVQPASANGLEFVAQLKDADGNAFPTAAGMWAYGDYVFGSGLNQRIFIADVSDPANPVLVYHAPEDSETSFARDADLVHHEDGRITLALATQFDGVHFWDVTVPEEATFLARVVTDSANHNVAVLPGTTLVFNSQSGGESTTNDLIDAADPSNPVILGTYGEYGCHDISFFGGFGGEKFRAYCAGIDRTEVWNLDGLNTSMAGFGITVLGIVDFDDDPTDSPVIGNPLFEAYPLRTLHHLAMVNEDASILIIGDEHNGGGTPGTCLLYDETTGASTPLGALWFYDLSDETNPTLLSWFSPPLVAPTVPPALDVPSDPATINPTNPAGVLSNIPNCTAHFGTLVPGEEKLVIGWYSAGVLLIDFSNPSSPTLLDQYMPEGTNPWDARVQDGYVFTGDIGRGMDVLKLV
ncbi:MAG: LVIVD repeat-containing protein [Thermoplasmatota archaeon]